MVLSTKSGVFVDKMTVSKDLSTKSGVFVDKSELVKDSVTMLLERQVVFWDVVVCRGRIES